MSRVPKSLRSPCWVPGGVLLDAEWCPQTSCCRFECNDERTVAMKADTDPVVCYESGLKQLSESPLESG